MKNRRIRRSMRVLCALLPLLLLLPQRSLAAETERCYPACESGFVSLVDALKSVGADASFSARKRIAGANGIADYRGTADQNIALLKQLTEGRLLLPEAGPLSENQGRIPFIHQGRKTCKASAVAMALNLLLGSGLYTTEVMGGDCCRGIDGERFTSCGGRSWTAVYRTDSYIGSRVEQLSAIDEALAAGIPAVAAVHSTRGGTQHHWVLILGSCGEDYLIADPAMAGSGSIADNAVTMSSRGYAFGLADDETLHFGYVTFTED